MNLGTLAAWLTAAVTLVATACGGGGGGGIGGTGIQASFGTITELGSVTVNGVKFDTDTADIVIDDAAGRFSELRVGMVVRVDGSIANRTADTVRVDDAIKGRVERVIDANRMLVMGQTVRVDAGSVPAGTAGFGIGDFVEVHGLVVAEGTVAAGFVQAKTPAATDPFAVKGFVTAHDTAARSLRIGTLNVSYGAATTVDDLPGGSWNGRLVEVKGAACAGTPVCGTLAASKIEPSGLTLTQADQAEVEGYVTSLASTSSFVVGTQRVATSATTRYEGGVAGELAVGVKLEVEGSVNGGVLSATKVSFRDSLRFEGDIAALDPARSVLTIAGLPGVSVRLNSLTEFDGGSAAALAVGEHVRIRARPGAGTAEAIATEVEPRSADSRVILQAPASAVAAPVVTLLGVAVDTSGIADADFRNSADQAIGRSAFFAAVKPGTIVKARGERSGANVAWDEIEIEE